VTPTAGGTTSGASIPKADGGGMTGGLPSAGDVAGGATSGAPGGAQVPTVDLSLKGATDASKGVTGGDAVAVPKPDLTISPPTLAPPTTPTAGAALPTPTDVGVPTTPTVDKDGNAVTPDLTKDAALKAVKDKARKNAADRTTKTTKDGTKN